MREAGVLRPQPLKELAAVDAADGWWHAMGAKAAFRLAPEPFGLPQGWTCFTVSAQVPHRALLAPVLEVNTASGHKPLWAVSSQRSSVGCWRLIVHVPPDATELLLIPPIVFGPFYLGPIRAKPMHRSMVAAKLAWSLGQGWVRQPRRLAETVWGILAAWQGGGSAGLRRALGLALLGPQPLEAAAVRRDRYREWIVENEAAIDPALPHAKLPCRVSVLIAVGPGGHERLKSSLAALQAQSGTEWDCLVGSAANADTVAVAKAVGQSADARISSLPCAKSDRSTILQALVTRTTGDLLLVLDPGDVLAPQALAALARVPGADITHGDEDQLRADGSRGEPFLKPEFSPEMLAAFNYFGRPTALRRSRVEEAGGFTAGLGVAAEWDLHLRLTQAGASVVRVARVLCHRGTGTDPDRPGPDGPAAAQHRAALAAHWHRLGIAAAVTTQADGTQRSVLATNDPPLVSIIIPSKDQARRLASCLRGIAETTRYPRLQVVVVDGGSTDPATLALHARLQGERRVEVVRMVEPFNAYAACNIGARTARGEFLLFLADDAEISSPDWVSELVGFALRSGVGVVGGLVQDSAGGLQHAGVVIGLQLCGNIFRGSPTDAWGPIGSPLLPRNLSAVGGGCQMVRRAAFDRVGGFDETYMMANGDVAFCLAVRAAGWRIAYAPFARLLRPAGSVERAGALPVDLRRTATDIRRFGYDGDPFFPAALDAGSSRPRHRNGLEPSASANLACEIQRHTLGAPDLTALDLCDDGEVADAVGVSVAELLWPPVQADAIDDQWSAARWCLDLVRRRSDLRQRFPDALSSGGEGAFARWLAHDAAQSFGVPAAAISHIAAALGARLSVRARKAVLLEFTSASERAVIFLPLGRVALLRFLLQQAGTTLRMEEIWWLALECAEDPAKELVFSYRVNPQWQALFPDGLTVSGRHRFAAWFRAVYRCDDAWADPERWPESLPVT